MKKLAIMVRVLFYLLVLIMKFIITRVLFQGKNHGKASFDRVRCYEKLGKHADYIFSAKLRPSKFKRSDDVYFFVKCLKLMVSVLDKVLKLVIEFSIVNVFQ